jgi:phospholipid/cholesterol/gamma-HCH transport system substrate-binding protein
VRVGRIEKIRLTKDLKSEVVMSVRSSVHIPKDSEALLRTTSLLGEKFVELRPLDTKHPEQGPFLQSGDRVAKTGEAPELEFFAEQAISVLGAVTGNDVATLVDTGAEAFGGRGTELRKLVDDLSTISATLASRSTQITQIIDNIDKATATLAESRGSLGPLLDNLATTTQVLSENRDRAVEALRQLSRLAAVQNDVLDRYESDLDRQIKQVDAIVDVAAGQTAEVGTLVTWIDRFVTGLPKAIPGDFTQVYMWVVPQSEDPRTKDVK